jgi:hypothetical protein
MSKKILKIPVFRLMTQPAYRVRGYPIPHYVLYDIYHLLLEEEGKFMNGTVNWDFKTKDALALVREKKSKDKKNSLLHICK